MDLNVAQVALGRALFLDRRLSGNDTVSCANCHPLRNYGVDGLPHSIGTNGRVGNINAPTVYNSGFKFRQFWDGRAPTLEAQVNGPVANHVEMASSWPLIMQRLSADAKLQSLSRKGYGAPLSAPIVRAAIATFERSLVTADAPFDRYLRGDTDAIGPDAKAGWKLFRNLGCVSCHNGIDVGGNMYAPIGVMDNYFALVKRAPTKVDEGLFNLTHDPDDRYKFVVPSLRNVAKTAPYFHDGSVKHLSKAVDIMAQVQLGIKLDAKQTGQLLAFLRSLTGRLPASAP
jgi:cytochrome c peroxidase